MIYHHSVWNVINFTLSFFHFSRGKERKTRQKGKALNVYQQLKNRKSLAKIFFDKNNPLNISQVARYDVYARVDNFFFFPILFSSSFSSREGLKLTIIEFPK